MKETKRIIVLGATGSIGKSALDVIRRNPDCFSICALSAHTDARALSSLTDEFPGAKAVLSGTEGEQALLSMIRDTDADIVVNGIAGASGLLPSVATLESGKDLALANKETIVMAGPLVRATAIRNGRNILPVDSEHSAVFSLISAYGKDAVSEVILTASGGPFRTWDEERIRQAKAADALKHPTWSMGSKITIDSASLANKGLEVIEAVRLFDLSPDSIKVVVHPESLVHSFIRTRDGVLYAQVSHPDMRHPILSALSWPETFMNDLKPLSFDEAFSMRFEPPRRQAFPMLGLAYRAASLGCLYPICYNAANEIAVEKFLSGSIPFGGIAELVAAVMDDDWSTEPSSIEEVLEADRRARGNAMQYVEERAW